MSAVGGKRKGSGKGQGKPAKVPRYLNPSPASQPVTTNMVYTAHLKCSINLKLLADGLGGCYNRNRFPACQIRNRDPWAALGFHGNGHVLIVGAKSPENAMLALHIQLHRMFSVFGNRMYREVHNFHLQNVVSPFNIGFAVNLKLLFDDYREKAQYDPVDIGDLRLYPRGMKTPPTLIIWASGKAHVTGSVNDSDVKEAYEYVDFTKYRLGHEYRQLEEKKAD